MATPSGKRPRGKVKSRTPVPGGPPSAPPGTPSPRRAPRALRTVGIPVLALLVAIGLGVFLGVRASRSGDDLAAEPPATTVEDTPTTTAPPEPRPARELFGDACATCHSLADAGANGGIGPNLDQARPTRERVLTFIERGSLSGLMPAGLLQGQDAVRVAAYVAGVAGR